MSCCGYVEFDVPIAHLLVDIQRNRAFAGHELRIKRVGDIDLGPSGTLTLVVVLEGGGNAQRECTG